MNFMRSKLQMQQTESLSGMHSIKSPQTMMKGHSPKQSTMNMAMTPQNGVLPPKSNTQKTSPLRVVDYKSFMPGAN